MAEKTQLKIVHGCDLLMISCGDHRIISPAYGMRNALLGEYEGSVKLDELVVPGGCRTIAGQRREQEGDRLFLLNSIATYISLHGEERIAVVQHMDCGDYGGHSMFENPQHERAVLIRDIDLAAKSIVEHIPHGEILVDGFIAHLNPSDERFDYLERVFTTARAVGIDVA